ncbi:YbaB/EbfC family nucleoid-associated protein [Salegentibacter salarius]|uniref:Outer membrane protein beta-barrel domain-containing protein n=1 Tax=Salegentibacter salarius TaxID=435906 RepID=A0A2N0U0N1_9FLAO|nr:YbaB/EbfC family nucleoid-associated protein [Salegentibacter salarius]OEY73515.1 hypothetical protein BHS39_08645 [Salegentibacter salarius]PKD20551.1 hypothetical protein APR40_08640 [Salegentibacter salarius]SLJ95697.1 hypothetical protein SAMN05660445_01761 [Salegentibacter salarius]
MKTIIFYITLSLFSLGLQEVSAQEVASKGVEFTSEEEAREFFEKEKAEIVAKEKEKLKYQIERINGELERGEITSEEGEKKKKELAEKHAKNIENKIAILENEMELRDRNADSSENYIVIGGKGKVLDININTNDKYDKRTTSDLVIAAGFNNALEKGQSLNNSDFKLAGSRFFEIGWAWKTRVFKETNWLRVRYGLSFQFNGLKPTDNRIFVEDGNETYLQEFALDLDKSKFRMDNLVVPIHFEIGPSKKTETESRLHFSTYKMLKIGFGGYAGFNIGERQKLKYKDDGDKVKEKLKNNYNTNDLVYGLSAYLGWGGATLYGKYDLNPIFQDPNRELHNFSLGLRFDVD